MDTSEIQIIKYKEGRLESLPDMVVREDPLEIFINGEKKYFCMRMPGMDYELVLGILYNEGIIDSVTDIVVCETGSNSIYLQIKRKTFPGIKKIFASSGSMFSDDLVVPTVQRDGELNVNKMFSVQREFFTLQKVFDKTGGAHAVAFYDIHGELISFAEDVGRHNALDKCMGTALLKGMSGKIFLILLSSRISFEMIRKSIRTGAVIVAGVSAPTSAAIYAALQSGVTLIGYFRGENFNIYSHPRRITNI